MLRDTTVVVVAAADVRTRPRAIPLAKITMRKINSWVSFKVEWYPIYGPKSLFKFGEKRPIVCYCTRE